MSSTKIQSHHKPKLQIKAKSSLSPRLKSFNKETKANTYQFSSKLGHLNIEKYINDRKNHESFDLDDVNEDSSDYVKFEGIQFSSIFE